MNTRYIYKILKSTFGYDTFRDPQEEIIRHTLDGKDAMVILPTGGGKSLCYQIPALASEGVNLLVSPLIALVNGYVINLEQVEVATASLHSNMTPEESMNVERKLNPCEIKLLFMSPERIDSKNTQACLQTL